MQLSTCDTTTSNVLVSVERVGQGRWAWAGSVLGWDNMPCMPTTSVESLVGTRAISLHLCIIGLEISPLALYHRHFWHCLYILSCVDLIAGRQTWTLSLILLLYFIGNPFLPHWTASQGITQLCNGWKWMGWWCSVQPFIHHLLKKSCRTTWNEQGHAFNWFKVCRF